MSLFNERTAKFGKRFDFQDNAEGAFVLGVQGFSKGKTLPITGIVKTEAFDDSYKEFTKSFFFTPDHSGELCLDKLSSMDPQPLISDHNLEDWELKCLEDDVVVKAEAGVAPGTWSIPVKNVDLNEMKAGTELTVYFTVGYYFNPEKKSYGPYLKAKQIEGLSKQTKPKKK